MVLVTHLLTRTIAIEHDNDAVWCVTVLVVKLLYKEYAGIGKVLDLHRLEHLIILDHIVSVNQDIAHDCIFALF